MAKRAAPLVYPIGLWASVLGIVQGLAWTVMALIAVLLYYNAYEYELDFSTYFKTLSTFVYILYVNNDSTNVTDIIVTPSLLVIFAWIYLFLSFIWFCWSSWQLWLILHGKVQFIRTSFVIWSILTSLVAILDVVLTSLLAHDYNYYVTNVAGVENSSLLFIILANGVLMSLAARGYVLWLINVIFEVALIKIVANGVEEKTSYYRGDRAPINAFAPVRAPNQNWSENGDPQTSNPDAWISNPSAIINEAFDFMGEQKPPPLNRSQSLSRISNGNSHQNGDGIKTSSPAGSYKVATIGRKGISATTLAPFIPEPDYTPPASPDSKKKPSLKSVLKSRSQYT